MSYADLGACNAVIKSNQQGTAPNTAEWPIWKTQQEKNGATHNLCQVLKWKVSDSFAWFSFF